MDNAMVWMSLKELSICLTKHDAHRQWLLPLNLDLMLANSLLIRFISASLLLPENTP